MADIIFCVERLKALVLGEIEPPLYFQHAFFDTDVDIVLLDAGHLKDDGQGILRFVNIRGWHKDACGDRRLLLLIMLPLLLNLKLLFLSHGALPIRR